MKHILFALSISLLNLAGYAQDKPTMYFTDTTSGKPIAKDPKIVQFKGKYWMYYSIPGKANAGWHIGVAQSDNLFDWHKIGELYGEADYEKWLMRPRRIGKRRYRSPLLPNVWEWT